MAVTCLPLMPSNDELTAKWLLAFASIVILGFESRGTHDHILLSHVSGSRATVVCAEQWSSPLSFGCYSKCSLFRPPRCIR
jgi:hypothetical protein